MGLSKAVIPCLYQRPSDTCPHVCFRFLFTVSSWPLPESGGPFIDQVFVLQSYAEGWKEGTWEEKIDERPCIDPLLYAQDKHEYYRCGRWAPGGRVPFPAWPVQRPPSPVTGVGTRATLTQLSCVQRI